MPAARVDIPKSGHAKLNVQGREVALTNLEKPFWPELGITKGDLIQYYADVAPHLLPHIQDRAMVMKRYPHGAHGEFFFMKRAPSPRPAWIRTCRIDHKALGNAGDWIARRQASWERRLDKLGEYLAATADEQNEE